MDWDFCLILASIYLLPPLLSSYTTVDPLPSAPFFLPPTISVFILGSDQFSILAFCTYSEIFLVESIESTALGWTGVIIYSGLNNLSSLHVSYGQKDHFRF